MSCKSASFYIKSENLEYIDDQIKDKPRYNKSNWLDDLVDHLRKKNKPKVDDEVKTKTKRFKPPSIDEVRDYMLERGDNNCQAEKFYDFYTSNGWKVGKNKMKDWKASVNNWLRGNKGSAATGPIKTRAPGRNITTSGYDPDIWDIEKPNGE